MTEKNERNDRLLSSRVSDAVRSARDRHICSYIGFLDEHSAAVCRCALTGEHWNGFSFFGGYSEAERVMLGVFDDYTDPSDAKWPIVPITVTYRKNADVNHRSVLGSLMSLGIAREKIGDILVSNGYSVFFTVTGIADYICTELSRIGGEGVRTEMGCRLPLPSARDFEQLRETIASPRLDCVVASLCRVSRSEAVRMIEAGTISVDGAECMRVSCILHPGNKLSVREKGKYIIDDMGSVTRKGKLVLNARKYI